MNDAFRKFAHHCSNVAGSPWAFSVSVFIIVVWALLGPKFGYSDTWQLIINTGTTIVTFLMVFLIQNTQNRDSKSLHLKIDELIHANAHARNMMIDIDNATDEELDRLHDELCEMHERTAEKIEHVKGHRQRRKEKAA
jgi:low affinity Fe/Cu permease